MSGSLSPWSRAADIVFLTRPPLLCVASAFFFAGAAHGPLGPLETLRPRNLAALAPGLLLYLLIVSASFVINQIYDVESDRLNEKNLLLASGLLPRRDAAILWAALVLAACFLAAHMGKVHMVLAGAGLLLGLAYSMPPVRLKARPPADVLANGVGFGFIGFSLGWLAVSPGGTAMVVRAVPYTLAMCGIFLNTTVPDETGDRAAGDRTACVAYGRSGVARAAALLVTSAGVAALALGEAPCALAAAPALPAFIAVAEAPGAAVSVLASQFAGRAFFFAVSAAMPPLAAGGALVYAAAKVYYRRRFGLDYPRVEGARARERMYPGT